MSLSAPVYKLKLYSQMRIKGKSGKVVYHLLTRFFECWTLSRMTMVQHVFLSEAKDLEMGWWTIAPPDER